MSNDRNGDGVSERYVLLLYEILGLHIEGHISRAARDGFLLPLFPLPHHPIAMNIAQSGCRGCGRIFDTPRGLSQHLSQTNKTRCRVAFSSSHPQSLIQSSHSEYGLLTSPPNSTSSGLPEQTFGSEHPSGHGGIYSDSPAFSLEGDMDECKFALH
jgi:hypothetical protein